MTDVKSQEARDEQSITIATALAIFLGTLVLGVGSIALVGAVTDMSRTFGAALPLAVVVAAVAGTAYVIRHNV